jgi:shikimate dehydrogenase
MTRELSRDTQLCMSLAGRPGNFGTRFHNFLYRELDLDFVYKAFTTTDLPAAIGGIRALGIRGCAVSMPYKEACIPLLDALDDSAAAIDSVNTIVNTAGELRGYNTDYVAVRQLLAEHAVPRESTAAVRGSGGMAKAVLAALRDSGFTRVRVLARNELTGPALAQAYGFAWSPTLDGAADLLVNVTPVGMAGGRESAELAFDEAHVRSARTVFDVVALPAETPLIKLARAQHKAVITGAEVIALQAVEQFVRYTGVRPSDELVRRAAAHAAG